MAFTANNIESEGYITGTTISAITISATTYSNLPTDIRVTGGTYNNSTGIATYTNNTGGTFTVTGFTTGGTGTDTFVTGFTYSNNVIVLAQNQGQTNKQVLINTMTGLTVNGSISATTLTATTVSANTYYSGGTELGSVLTPKIDLQGLTLSAAVTTSSTSFIDLTGMTATTHNLNSNGTYKIDFTAEVFNTTNLSVITFQLLVNGVVDTSTIRDVKMASSSSISNTIAITTVATNLASGSTIRPQWKVSRGTATINGRSITILGFPTRYIV